ncbi:single-stranded-DNA-specific exonuclease RecJ [Corallincola luteus]|uniref:Single-stranded-DNA-specific exonuclease RecJ n=1 Tax=Corallincola luteus TaxID=1775177 RepID=A0ABY2AS09_9GAMM|nr:single-stranded-DNA-specific exonuclease RecJ [Corallincola luteus]TCI04986.1 single-stranded-DNA-specific exonuclease RecJ [Corallincola luteus]
MSMTIERRPLPAADAVIAGLPPLLQRIYASRGITAAPQLERQTSHLARPTELKGMQPAVVLLADALNAQKRLLIVGDFDADGATSSALCVLALRAMGAKFVDFLVPNRFDYGYGLSPEIADVAHQQGAELLITVDNGISSIQGVAKAKQLGMQVLITDHHLPGEQLPAADAIVNPNQPGCEFPSKSLAGVGVAFYLLSALRTELRQRGWFAQQQLAEPNLADWLDIVALGTVADVVPLDQNNRILVHQGLQRIRSGRCRPGIQALIDLSQRKQREMTASDLGFALGPRLNAAGRLDDISLGINCLLCDDFQQAKQMAEELDTLNRSRREIEQGMEQEALAALSALDVDEADLPLGLCLFQPDWHQGVIGILASRIKERFYRPVLAFADAGNGELKGSARSISGLHMRDLLEQIDSQHPALIIKFGGHAMAAGLSIHADNYARFQQVFEQTVAATLTPSDLSNVVLSDGELSLSELTLDTAYQLRDAGPWGQAFPAPVFDGEFWLLQQRIVGQRHLKMVLSPDNGVTAIDAIAFNVDTETWPDPSIRKVHVAYQLDANEFRGNVTLQFVVQYLQGIAG